MSAQEPGGEPEDRGLITRLGSFEIDWPKSLGYYGGIGLALAFEVIEPPLALFIAAIPVLKLLKRPREPWPFRVAADVLEGAAKPVGGDAESVVRVAGPSGTAAGTSRAGPTASGPGGPSPAASGTDGTAESPSARPARAARPRRTARPASPNGAAQPAPAPTEPRPATPEPAPPPRAAAAEPAPPPPRARRARRGSSSATPPAPRSRRTPRGQR